MVGPAVLAERDGNTNPGTIKQVLTHGSARTSGFRWKANRQVRCSYPISSAYHSTFLELTAIV